MVHVWNRLTTRDGSIVYEVNPDHPMIDALVEEYPGIRPKIESASQTNSYVFAR